MLDSNGKRTKKHHNYIIINKKYREKYKIIVYDDGFPEKSIVLKWSINHKIGLDENALLWLTMAIGMKYAHCSSKRRKIH